MFQLSHLFSILQKWPENKNKLNWDREDECELLAVFDEGKKKKVAEVSFKPAAEKPEKFIQNVLLFGNWSYDPDIIIINIFFITSNKHGPHLTKWAMSQLVSEDRGPMISTPSSVTMAISCCNKNNFILIKHSF